MIYRAGICPNSGMQTTKFTDTESVPAFSLQLRRTENTCCLHQTANNQGHLDLRHLARSAILPSPSEDKVGAGKIDFGARWPACRSPVNASADALYRFLPALFGRTYDIGHFGRPVLRNTRQFFIRRIFQSRNLISVDINDII